MFAPQSPPIVGKKFQQRANNLPSRVFADSAGVTARAATPGLCARAAKA
jgi:hypothetical protein